MRPTPLLVLALSLSVGCFVKPVDSADPGPVDADGDGYDEDADCDDADAAVFPGADELCNEVDDDCDGTIDEDDAIDAPAWLPDADGDGYGDRNTEVAIASCTQPSGRVDNALDCDDDDADIFPGQAEHCDGVDEDCDGDIDEGAIDATTWYLDYDLDGYGGTSQSTDACEAPGGFVANGDDCDDLDDAVFPGAGEVCNGVDDDCDGTIDNDVSDGITYYLDNDGDGYGLATGSDTFCEQPSGYAEVDGDCNDADDAIHPGAEEWCDGIDNDCDGVTDESGAGDATDWYPDDDGDGYGWFYASPVASCAQPVGYVADDTDCNDGEAAVNPGAGGCNWVSVSDVQDGTVTAGTVVTVMGQVMHDALTTGFHLADAAGAYNGVWIYANSSSMVEGDLVVLSGTVAEYYDLTEIAVSAASRDIVVLDSGTTLPAATVVATADLADPVTAETYEGVLVTVNNVEVEDEDLGYNEFSVDDGVVVDDLLYLCEEDLAVGGSFVSITGLLYYSFGNYKIVPRYAADMVGYAAPPCLADACAEELVAGDLVITEIMFDPAFCADGACEWFELYNATGGSVDLDGLIVQDAGGNTATVTGSAEMAADSYVVLAIGSASTWGYTGFTPDGYYGTTVALGNSGDQVIVANSGGVIDEAAAWTGGPSGASLGLDPTMIDATLNDDSAAWCTASSAIGSTGDSGTPGTANDACI